MLLRHNEWVPSGIPADVDFTRGFVSRIRNINYRTWERIGDEIRKLAPIESVQLLDQPLRILRTLAEINKTLAIRWPGITFEVPSDEMPSEASSYHTSYQAMMDEIFRSIGVRSHVYRGVPEQASL